MLTPEEKEFIRTHYLNYTAKDLTVSLNNIRKRFSEAFLKKHQVVDYIFKFSSEAAAKANQSLKPPSHRVLRAKQSQDDRKTKAMRDYQNVARWDELCVPLEELEGIPDDDEKQPRALSSEPDDQTEGDEGKNN